jgi:uncharacterized protein (TIGR02145 family)
MVLRFLFIAFMLLIGCGDLSFDNLTDPRNVSHPDNIAYQSFTDSRDGKTYKSVVIGTQTWMAENLNYKTEDGSSYCAFNVERKETKQNMWGNQYTEVTILDTLVNDGGYCDIYGRLYSLYDWAKVKTVCPSGWHLPNNAEWNILINFVGSNAGTKLKSKSGWKKSCNGTDDYGFSALPGSGSNGGDWLSFQGEEPSGRNIGCSEGTYYSSNNLVSVRCVKDELCGSQTYNGGEKFCYKNSLYNLCGDKTYNPEDHRCNYDNVLLTRCGNGYNYYNPDTQRCVADNVESRCGTGWYNEITQFCSGNAVYERCKGKTYLPDIQRCGTDNVIENKCGTVWYNDSNSTQYCFSGALKPYGKLTDARDSKAYKTVEIGTQLWMAENLNYNASGSKCRGNLESSCDKYGKLYDWATAMDLPASCNSASCSSQIDTNHKGICPTDWHIPSQGDWNVLLTAVGGVTNLKAANDWDGTNAYGFSALPGGYGYSGNFSGYNEGRWWTATEATGYSASEAISQNMSDMWYRGSKADYLYSVRCVNNTVKSSSSAAVSSSSVAVPGSSSSVQSSSSVPSSSSAPSISSSSSSVPLPPSSSSAEVVTGSCDINDYSTVEIGEQVWMAENLNCNVSGSVCYNNEPANCATYGRLYNWSAAIAACPEGWHLPSDAEWTALENYVGGSSTAGKKLKAASGWSSNGNGTDEFDFAALPGGYGNASGNFSYVGDGGLWWYATEDGASDAYFRYMNYAYEGVYYYDVSKGDLLSVRCLQD